MSKAMTREKDGNVYLESRPRQCLPGARRATMYGRGRGKVCFQSPFFTEVCICGFTTQEEAYAAYLAIAREGREVHKQRLVAGGVKPTLMITG